MGDFYIKVGDTAPSITATMLNGAGAAIDLTGATVQFRMRALLGDTLKVNSPATPGSGGTARYDWQPADTDTEGTFLIEWLVTNPGGTVQTVPNASYDRVRVVKRL